MTSPSQIQRYYVHANELYTESCCGSCVEVVRYSDVAAMVEQNERMREALVALQERALKAYFIEGRMEYKRISNDAEAALTPKEPV